MATYRYFNQEVGVTTVVTEINVDAAELLNAYTSDASTANSTYLDKVIQVSGKADEINIDGDDSFVDVTVPGSEYTVRCTFDKENSVLLYKISSGMAVEITGTCKGMSSGDNPDLNGRHVILSECTLDGYYN